jgi:hypothetical protein
LEKDFQNMGYFEKTTTHSKRKFDESGHPECAHSEKGEAAFANLPFIMLNTFRHFFHVLVRRGF